jgi:hypothetical protein
LQSDEAHPRPHSRQEQLVARRVGASADADHSDHYALPSGAG